jgi:hypothetical protein
MKLCGQMLRFLLNMGTFATVVLGVVTASCRSNSSKPMNEVTNADSQLSEESPLFRGSDVISFSLDIPSSSDPMTYAASSLSYVNNLGGDEKIDVLVKVRGHSSVNEYGFPKRSVKLAQPAPGGSPFAHLNKFKIGTHCGSVRPEPVIPPERHNEVLCHENATHREAFIYAALQKLGLPAQRARPARIKYTVYRPDGAVREVIDADAMVLEDSVGSRYADNTELGNSLGNPEDSLAKIHLLNALVGNVDWRIGADPSKHHNFTVLNIPNRGDYLVPSDFDRSSMVTGAFMHPNRLGPEFASKPLSFRQAAYLLKQAKAAVPPESLARVWAEFEAKQPELLSLLAEYHIDEEGKEQIKVQIEQFYEAGSVVLAL